MTVSELRQELDRLIVDGQCDVEIEGIVTAPGEYGGGYDLEIIARPTCVEKLGSRIVIQIEERVVTALDEEE